MGNAYFQFKQFLVRQEKSAMRITTDACIFGALVNGIHPNDRVLDLGAGTGLLSLMVAQSHQNCTIDAIEINQEAAAEAEANFRNSPFSNRLTCINQNFEEWMPEQRYDVVITNPPFYSNSLLSTQSNRNQALHYTGLTPKALLSHIPRVVNDQFKVWVLLPDFEMGIFDTMANNRGLSLIEAYSIIQHPKAERIFRKVHCYSSQCSPLDKTLVAIQFFIRDHSGGSYTKQFTDLLSPYYLHL